MAKDLRPIDEISAAIEKTENALKANIKTRAVGAVDRLVGAVADLASTHVEAFTERREAKTRNQVAAIDEAGRQLIERMKANPNFATAVVGNHYQGILRDHLNKEAVAQLALEDLRVNPSTEEQAAAGPEHLSDEFLDRFENYAADASTEELRERWAKVLASEVRSPGTFSRKTLRIIDEIDAKTAQMFEWVAGVRLGYSVPLSLFPKLNVREKGLLVESGLLADRGMGLFMNTQMVQLGGKPTSALVMHDNVFVLPSQGFVAHDSDGPLVDLGTGIQLPIEVLTAEGAAIASIILQDEDAVAKRLADEIAESYPGQDIALHRVVGATAPLLYVACAPVS